jgi:hypothetical protein
MRILAGLAAAIGVGLTVTVADAGATTQWFYELHDIPVGETVEVKAHGELTLGLKPLGRSTIKLDCRVTGVEAFWNTLENGLDETEAIAFACTAPCGKVSITPHLPWSSFLEGTTWPLPDKWTNMRLTVVCGATKYGIFEGTLTPGSGDGDVQDGKDEPDSYVGFRVGNGVLHASNGDALTIIGFYRFGASKDEVVTGEL